MNPGLTVDLHCRSFKSVKLRIISAFETKQNVSVQVKNKLTQLNFNKWLNSIKRKFYDFIFVAKTITLQVR